MKLISLITLLSLSVSYTAQAQHTIGIQGGIGIPAVHHGGDKIHSIFFNNSMRLTPTFVISYVTDHNKTVNWGCNINYERYSFIAEDGVVSPGHSSRIITNHVSNYILLSPLMDIGIGEYRYFHVGISPEIGFLVAGKETQADDYDHVDNISSNINKVIFRFNAQLRNIYLK